MFDNYFFQKLIWRLFYICVDAWFVFILMLQIPIVKCIHGPDLGDCLYRELYSLQDLFSVLGSRVGHPKICLSGVLIILN